MQLNYNMVDGLRVAITEFKSLLPSLNELKLSSTFTYGCCGKPINKPAKDIYSKEECPYCLEYYQTIKTFRSGYGYENPMRFNPRFDNDGRTPVLKENEPVYRYDYEKESLTKKEIEEQYGEVKFVGKERTPRFDNQTEFDIISNILEFVTESINNFNIYVDIEHSGFRNSHMFGAAELEYINRKNLNAEFSHIMTIKQIAINKFLIDCVKMIVEKIGKAGMELI